MITKTRSRLMLFTCLLASVLIMTSCTKTDVKPVKKGFSQYNEQAANILSKMTLEEKVGQMLQPDQGVLPDPAIVDEYHLGSILSGGSSDPKDGNTVEAWAQMYESYQKQALDTRLAIPLLYGVDAVHGHNNLKSAVIFPHNIGLGCTNNPDLMVEIGQVTAKEVRATGIHWTFAPCITVPRDDRWGRVYEGYSEDPELAGILGAATIRGLQGENLSDKNSVLACAKHFAGDGGTTFGTGIEVKMLDQGDTQIDEDAFREIHINHYQSSINDGVGSIMVSFNSWNGLKCSANKYLLTDILKGEMGFEGFLISDWAAIAQCDPDYKTAIEKCINAGMDMAMVPENFKAFYDNLIELVNEEKVPVSRINDAVTRILRVKIAMGLLDENPDCMASENLQKEFGSASHREVARRAVRESMVLLKNDKNLLPLSKTASRIHVAGTAADNIGIQCGGWTVDWQGGDKDIIDSGTTIFQAIKQAVSADTEVTFSEDGSGVAGADIAVVVIGEKPYAEMMGDRADLQLLDNDIATVKSISETGVPVVVVLFSGRTVMINEILDSSDAFVAAWLPGSEGMGVADVLFGDYKPTGKLSYTWPKSMSQIPINKGDKEYDPLFPFGFGLSY